VARLRLSMVVQAPKDRVWAVISNPEVMALHCSPQGRLSPKIDKVEITSPQHSGEGMTWKLTGEFRGKPYWAEHRAVAYEEGKHLSYTIVQDSLGAHERMRDQVETYELEALADGATRVTRTSTFKLRGFMLRLIFPLFFKPAMSNIQLASLLKLKAWVEGQREAGA